MSRACLADPQTLIGTWSGKWPGIWGGGSQTRRTAAGAQRTPFVGTFDGQRLTYGTVELVLDGNRLSGKRTGVPNYSRGINIDMTKEK